MRDKIKNEQYFSKFFDENIPLTEGYKHRALENDRDYSKRLGSAYNFFRKSCHNAVATYSAGQSAGNVKALAVAAVDALAIFVELGQQDQEYFLHGDGGGYSGGFDQWYRLLAWCILFDLPREKTDIVIDYLVLQMRLPEHATDALVNRMVKHLGYPGQDETDHLLWPKAYRPLYDCFKVSVDDRPQQLESFTNGWYRSMRGTYWYDSHKNKHEIYFGYWCFEAAAVGKMLKINDERLRNHPNYPYDARHRR